MTVGGKCTVLAELSHTLGPGERTSANFFFFYGQAAKIDRNRPLGALTLVCNRRNRQRMIGWGRPLTRGVHARNSMAASVL